ncbi:PEP/pyruvate-binding domain-containing protein [Brevundimonas sp.]|jgi:pyruvate,water dikinase|uniref:PEP/pyruvate-binding domain-containing protein n=1 Tax=Brevundimonas sp. TaxID=1871086 RepID=UPI003D11435E
MTMLKGEAARDRARAGGKGAVLAELADAFDVPEFFVVPTDAFGPEGLLPQAVADLEAALSALGAGPFAVRSSAVDEDGAEAAHSGQFDTLLNVAPGDVIQAVAAVWRSGFSESLSAYRLARGLSGDPQPPAVVIQRMAAATAAGVAFTADPVSGAHDVVVISAVKGLADQLVSGEEDGETWRIHSDRVEAPSDPVLTPEQAQRVAEMARRAEARYGRPQDVEWALEGDRLVLLQSRPITTLAPLDPQSIGIWDNSNIVESYPGVVSPFTFTFARRVYGHVYRAFSAMMGVGAEAIADQRATFDTMLGRVHGRVYYNLLAWYRALSLFPGFKANRAFMEQMMGVGEPLPAALAEQIAPNVHSGLDRLLDRLRLLGVLVRLTTYNFTLPGVIRRFYARLNLALAESDAEIEALSATQLAARYRLLENRLLERWDAPLINDFLCMVAFGASRKAMEAWAGAQGLTLHSDIMIGQGDIVSAEPARRIRQMGETVRGDADLIARLAKGEVEAVHAHAGLKPLFDAYIARFGDRCTEELKLESVTLHEDPRQLLAAIATAARVEPRAHEVETNVQAVGPRMRALFAGRPLKRRIAAGLTAWAKTRVRDRENLRFERTRLFGRVRRIVRASGRRMTEAGVLHAEGDVFLLTVEEWLGAVEGGVPDRGLKALVEVRRAEQAQDLARADPPERLTIRGGFLIGLPSAEAAAGTDSVDADAGARSGQPCCAGVVTARVRVIADPRIEALEAGEILVARHTDPGWIAVFANASGVIAERGSLLSHSAIVAREMGVPCVVALKGATTWLKTGDLVRLDGGTGRVEKVEAGS